MYALWSDWMSCAVSSVSISGGLLVSWDPHYFVFSPVLTYGGIFLISSSLVDKRRLSLLNVYGPCTDRKIFWKKLEDRGLLAHTHLILVRDLNFTLKSYEIWGLAAFTYPLAIFFKDLFDNSSLVDVAPTELVPMWRNGRIGDSSIAKRLERFFVAEDLIGPAMRYISCVESPFFFDHAPIILQLDIGLQATTHTFKFNPFWLRDDSFAKLASEVWFDARFELVEGAQRRLVENITLLKSRIKSWSKEKHIRDQDFIKILEVDLEMIYV
jgi:hypothetical protein